MGEKNVRFLSRERVSAERAAQLLRELADKLLQQQVTFRRHDEEVSLELPGELMLEIEVVEKVKKYGRKHSIEIELEWVEGARPRGSVSVE